MILSFEPNPKKCTGASGGNFQWGLNIEIVEGPLIEYYLVGLGGIFTPGISAGPLAAVLVVDMEDNTEDNIKEEVDVAKVVNGADDVHNPPTWV